MGLSVDVLGAVEVRHDGVALELGPRRHAEVVAALAVDAGHLVTAEQLMARVWGVDATVSPTTLHALISRLRARLRTVGADALLVTEGPGYRLDPAVAEVDAAAFAAHLLEARRLVAERQFAAARERALAALGLWRARPYAGVRAAWADAEADRLTELWLTTHELLAEARLEIGAHGEVLDVLPALVADQPLRETLRGALMLAQYRAGRQADALATYETGRVALADELGIDPGPDLQRLWTRMLRQDPALLAAPPVAPPATLPGPRRGLVGRTTDLAQLRALLAEAGQGRGAAAALVSGEAGIGKSSLVDALVAAVPDGVVVVRGSSSEHGGAPALWPWEQALGDLVGRLGPEAVRRWLPAEHRARLAAVLPALHDGPPARTAQVRLFDDVARLLRGAAEQHPLLVVLEDLHWADAGSVQLLDHVLRTLRADRVALVVTVRDPEPGARARTTEITEAVTRAGGLLLPLGGLTVDEVADLAGTPRADAALLHARTEGNPLYVVELTRLHGAGDDLPRGVRAVVEGRLRGLSPGDRALLAAAAVAGRSVDHRLVAEVSGEPAAAVADALDRSADHGLLVAHGGGLGFSHALVQEVLEATVAPVRRAALHAQVAEALVRRYGDEPGHHAARLAHHFARAGVVGDPAQAARYAVLAADQAERRAALGEAERLLALALDALGELPPAVAEGWELEVRTRLGALLSQRLGYDSPEVARERHRAVTLARRSGIVETRVIALWGLWGAALVAGDLVGAETLATELSEAATGASEPWADVAADQARGQTALLAGRLEEALMHLRAGVDRVDDLGDPRLDVFVQDPAAVLRGWLAAAATLAGADVEADAAARAALRVAAERDHAYTTAYLEILMAWRAVWREEPDEALARSQRAVEVARRSGFGQFETFALPPGAWALARRGELEAAAAQVERALEVHVRPGHHMFGTLMSSVAAEVELLAGRSTRALEVVTEAIATAERTGERMVLPRLLALQEASRRQAAADSLGP